VDDVINSIASQTGQEWYVDPTTRRLQWRVQYGRDRSGSVQLVDGVHITGYDPTFTLDGLTNALFAMPNDNRYQAARGFWVERIRIDRHLRAAGRYANLRKRGHPLEHHADCPY
jgi:hypothetical protein